MSQAYTIKSLSPLRRVIAARMSEAKRTIPHYRLVADIELDRLLAWREQLNARDPDAVKVSINDCLVKGCASALMRHPDVNVQLVGDEIHQYRHADISVVVAIDGGLVTPIVRRAECKSVHEIAAETKDFAARAARSQLRMDEIVGGSFSISSLGNFDITQFDAVINAPQCAILAVARARPRIVVAEQGDTRIATLLRVTLSVDHRAIDGTIGAAFLATLRQCLEQPQLLSEQQGR